MAEIDATYRFDAAPAAVFAALSGRATLLAGGGPRVRLLRESRSTRDGVRAVRTVRTVREEHAGALAFVEDIVAFEPHRPRNPFAHLARRPRTAAPPRTRLDRACA